MTFTGSSFKFENGQGDYNFSPRPCVLPFQGWDYEEVRKTSSDDSLPKMYGVYLRKILLKCVERLCRGEVKLHIILSNCLQMEAFLPSGLSYDRITTSNLCDRGYFMVGECGRFFFTSCERRERTSERSERVSSATPRNE